MNKHKRNNWEIFSPMIQLACIFSQLSFIIYYNKFETFVVSIIMIIINLSVWGYLTILNEKFEL